MGSTLIASAGVFKNHVIFRRKEKLLTPCNLAMRNRVTMCGMTSRHQLIFMYSFPENHILYTYSPNYRFPSAHIN